MKLHKKGLRNVHLRFKYPVRVMLTQHNKQNISKILYKRSCPTYSINISYTKFNSMWIHVYWYEEEISLTVSLYFYYECINSNIKPHGMHVKDRGTRNWSIYAHLCFELASHLFMKSWVFYMITILQNLEIVNLRNNINFFLLCPESIKV